MSTMQFLDVQQQQLVLSTTNKPVINVNQCLIKVKAIGINRADLLQREGKYPPPPGESDILGLEVSGEITEIPDESCEFSVGDRVFGLVAGGGYAEYVAIETSHLMKLPDNLSFVQGAATAEVFLTAYQSLFTIAGLSDGANVLIHAGASGVGTAAIQLAKAKECFVATTTGSDEKCVACFALGADVVLNYRQQDFVEETKGFLPSGYDVIVDVVAGSYVNRNLNVCALDGKIIILALLGGRFAEQVDIAKMLQKRAQIIASTLRNRSNEYKAELVSNFTRDFMPLLANGEIKPVVDKCYNWLNADEAHHFMASNKNIGKLVLTVS